jgi:hypothetical protein
MYIASGSEFRQQYSPDYRADLDLIFANPDGRPLKPDSVSGICVGAVPPLKTTEGS